MLYSSIYLERGCFRHISLGSMWFHLFGLKSIMYIFFCFSNWAPTSWGTWVKFPGVIHISRCSIDDLCVSYDRKEWKGLKFHWKFANSFWKSLFYRYGNLSKVFLLTLCKPGIRKFSHMGKSPKDKKVSPNLAVADEEQFKFRLQNREQHTQLH